MEHCIGKRLHVYWIDQNIKNLLLRSNKPVTPKISKKQDQKDKLGSFCSHNRIGKTCLGSAVEITQSPMVELFK